MKGPTKTIAAVIGAALGLLIITIGYRKLDEVDARRQKERLDTQYEAYQRLRPDLKLSREDFEILRDARLLNPTK